MSRFISYLNSCNCRISSSKEGLKETKKETKLVVYYDIQDISSPTTVCSNYDHSIKSMEIDGVMLDNVTTTYQFDSVGEHIIKYEFNDSTMVGNQAPVFNGIDSMNRVIIPDIFTSIGKSTFVNCHYLTNVAIGKGVTSIGNSAFGGCSGLTSMTVDSSNSTYDSRNNCNAIIKTSTNELLFGCKNTVIPNTVTSIGVEAFAYCSSLSSINIPNTVTSIGDYAFSNCTALTSIDIPNSVTTIGSNAFSYCSGLTSIDIPNGVTSIGEGTFKFCSGLTSVDIPNSVTSIGVEAFRYCNSLASFTLGSGVTSIGNYAFASCSSLTSITSLATTAPTIISNTFRDVHTNGTLYVPIGSSGYNTWMGTGNYYLGKYGWTKVEQ